MKLGLTSMNMGKMSDPALIRDIAQLAEELGYDSLWTADHIAMADPSPRMSPTTPMLEALMALGFLACCTKRVQLGTGVVILPQRQPVVLAKELASLDLLSGGRLLFGVGVGWQEAEMNSVGVKMNERGARADEYLDALIALWTMEKPEYHGKFVDFAGINAFPRPVQKPHVRLVMGGYAPATYRRTVQIAQGWFGFNRTVEQTRETVAALKEMGHKVQRPAHLGELEITISPPEAPTPDSIRAYAAEGVHRLLLRPPDGTPAEIERFVRDHAPAALGV